MDWVTGKDAIILLVEHKHGFHKGYTEKELAFLRKQREGFFIFLRKQGRSLEDTLEIINNIKKSTAFEITHEWQDSFIISQRRAKALDDAAEGIAFEIDLLMAQDDRPVQEKFDNDVSQDKDWDEKMEAAADRVEGKNPDSYWDRARDHLSVTDDCLTKLESEYLETDPELSARSPLIKQLSEEHREFLTYLTLRLRMMRGLYRKWEYKRTHWETKTNKFGKEVRVRVVTQSMRCPFKDGVWISRKMWMATQNRINRLLGEEKRYPISIVEETENEILSMPGVVLYGWDFERVSAESEVESSQED
jgi:hypothetical protein